MIKITFNTINRAKLSIELCIPIIQPSPVVSNCGLPARPKIWITSNISISTQPPREASYNSVPLIITPWAGKLTPQAKVEVQHICGYKYSVLPCNILQGYGCPKCNTKTKKSLEDVKQLLLDRLDDTYEVYSRKYINSSTPIEIIHKTCNTKFKISYKMRKIYISLSLLNLDKHFIYYLVPLLDEIINMTNNNW